MGEKIKTDIINNFSKHILKPLDNNNINNSCWVNSALYMLSAHPYIMFQYLLVDDTRLSTTKDIYNDIYINNIIYNYKYIKSENNEKSTLLYDETLHKNLYDKITLYNLINTVKWGEQYDAQIIVNLLYDIITKSHPSINNNIYLTVETRHLSNKTDIDKILYIENDTKKQLLGFVSGNECNEYDIHAYGDKDLNAVHWVSYIRSSLSNDNEWYKFDALTSKGKLVNKREIYDCNIKNYNKNLMCIYIDMDKFRKLLSNTVLRKKYDKFIELIEPTSYINNNKFENIMKHFSNDIIKSVGKNKYIDINLLSIQELEYFNKLKIREDYYDKSIIDKREYFINLN